MNRLRGHIADVETCGSMSRVEVDISGTLLSAYVLETPETCSYLRSGYRVDMLVKETEVSLARDLHGQISIGNRFPAIVREIKVGQLLAQIALDFQGMTVTAVIGARALRELALQPGEEVLVLIKSTELTLAEVADAL